MIFRSVYLHSVSSFPSLSSHISPRSRLSIPMKQHESFWRKVLQFLTCYLCRQRTNRKVAFDSISDITLAGSWANKVGVKVKDWWKFGVDLAVEMPTVSMHSQTPVAFETHDFFQSWLFSGRRTTLMDHFYLATIAAAIQSPRTGFNVEVFYESLLEDVRLTKLILVPKSGRSLPLHCEALADKICRRFPYWLYNAQCSSKHYPRSIALISNSPPPPITFTLKYPHKRQDKCKRKCQATNTPLQQRPSPLIYTKIACHNHLLIEAGKPGFCRHVNVASNTGQPTELWPELLQNCGNGTQKKTSPTLYWVPPGVRDFH